MRQTGNAVRGKGIAETLHAQAFQRAVADSATALGRVCAVKRVRAGFLGSLGVLVGRLVVAVLVKGEGGVGDLIVRF